MNTPNFWLGPSGARGAVRAGTMPARRWRENGAMGGVKRAKFGYEFGYSPDTRIRIGPGSGNSGRNEKRRNCLPLRR